MLGKERRRFPRYLIGLPVIIDSSRGIGHPEGWHHGEILDAGKEGMRMRVDGFGPLAEGTLLRLIVQPEENRQPKKNSLPVPVKGRVVWEDAGSRQFALRYVQEKRVA